MRYAQKKYLACYSDQVQFFSKHQNFKRSVFILASNFIHKAKTYEWNLSNHSGDLNSRNIWIANFYLFVIQMVCYSNGGLNMGPLTKWWNYHGTASEQQTIRQANKSLWSSDPHFSMNSENLIQWGLEYGTFKFRTF